MWLVGRRGVGFGAQPPLYMFECKRLCCAFEAIHQCLRAEKKRQLFLPCFLWSVTDIEATATKREIQAIDSRN